MATYAELFAKRSDDTLRDRVAVAVAVKAQELLTTGTPTASQIAWSVDAIDAPMTKAIGLLNYVLAANKGATIAQIDAVSDSALQTHVDAAVDVIVS